MLEGFIEGWYYSIYLIPSTARLANSQGWMAVFLMRILLAFKEGQFFIV
jgi:hypothetical protein